MTKVDIDATERAYKVTGNANTVTVRLCAEVRVLREVVEEVRAIAAKADGSVRRRLDAALAKVPLVPCYRLVDVLTPSQIEPLKEVMRPTFTEMWEALGASQIGEGAIDALLQAASDRDLRPDLTKFPYHDWSKSWWTAWGRAVEAALYSRAYREGCTVVMGPKRGSRRG